MFHVKNYRKKFSVSSNIFLKLFLFWNTKKLNFSKNNSKYEEGLKETYFL